MSLDVFLLFRASIVARLVVYNDYIYRLGMVYELLWIICEFKFDWDLQKIAKAVLWLVNT